MNKKIIRYLLDKKIITSSNPIVTPLTGGVSSDIFICDDGEHKIVIKKALAKLRIKDKWFAPTSRNKVEQDYIHYVSKICPDCMPKIIATDNELGFFAMEYLDEAHHNWKAELLQGIFKVENAQKAAEILAIIHRHSRNDPIAKETFIDHLAVATNAGQLKAGAFARSERTVKWNEVIRIQRQLEDEARFIGGKIYNRIID